MEGMKKTQQNTNNNGKFSSLKLKKSLKAQSEPVIRKKTDNAMAVSWNYCLYVEIDNIRILSEKIYNLFVHL